VRDNDGINITAEQLKALEISWSDWEVKMLLGMLSVFFAVVFSFVLFAY
jgi:hypothetical protein